MAKMKVFLSHSTADRLVAEKVVVALRSAGADVWFDEHNLGATHLLNEIQRQLAERPVFIALLSENAFASSWVRHECQWAWNIQQRNPRHIILPVVVAPIRPDAFNTMLFLEDSVRVAAGAKGDQPMPYDQMLTKILSLLALNPATIPDPPPTADTVKDMIIQGEALAAQKRWTEALEMFERAVRRSPRNVGAWGDLSWIYSELGRYVEGLNAVDRALALNDQQAWLWVNRNYALDRLDRYEESLEACDRALALDSSDATAWNNRSRALNHLKRYEEALVASEHALAIDPTYTFAWANKGRALVGLRRYKEALTACDQALALSSNYPNAWKHKGNALKGLKRYDEALIVYDRALTIDQGIYPLDDRAGVFHNKAKILVILGRTTEAEAAEQQAKELGG